MKKCEYNHDCGETAKFNVTTGHIANPDHIEVCGTAAVEMIVEDAFHVSDFDPLDGAIIDGMEPIDWLKDMTSE